MNFIWNLYGVLTLLPILVSMMNNSEETGIMCITDSPEKLENKFKFEIKKLEAIVQKRLQPYEDVNNDGADNDESWNALKKYLLQNLIMVSLETKTHRFLLGITQNKEKDFCTRVWNSCYSNLYPNKTEVYFGHIYIIISEKVNSIFKDTYYEHTEMLECAFIVDKNGDPSTSAITNTDTKEVLVTFRVAALERQKNFNVILEELRKVDISIPNDPRNINHYFQPLYVFDVLADDRCQMKAYVLMKKPSITISIEE